MIQKWPSGRVEISINDRQLNDTDSRPENKSGLSETKRKEVFQALVRAQDRAAREAANRYPMPNPVPRNYSTEGARRLLEARARLQDTLRERYENELLTSYNITRSDLEAISEEAFVKDWPLPNF
jgi:hypothetical protein